MGLPNCQDKVEEVKPLTPPSSSPASTSSSPTHEFSFTTTTTTTSIHHHHHSNPHPPPFTAVVDLSPADEIFFHGHLLPLHLLSHLASISPRSSTNSLDSFTLPMHQLLLQDQSNPHEQHNSNFTNQPKGHRPNCNTSFSLFGFLKWRKGCEIKERHDQEKQHKKKLLKFDVNNVLKRYIKMVSPLFRGSRNRQFRGKKSEFSVSFSAPVSTTTSPTNSGLLVATRAAHASCNGDSSMEELQAAIQAAIAHCKNSLAVEDKTKK